MAAYHDRKARAQTCARCGILRAFHEGSGCPGFQRMTDRQWAEECGVPVPPVATDPYRRAVVEAAPQSPYSHTYNLRLECGHTDVWYWEFKNGAGHTRHPDGSLNAHERATPASRHCRRCAKEGRLVA